MANDALEYLLASNLNINNPNPADPKFFPNPSSKYIYLNHSKNYKAVIFDFSGKQVIRELITDKIDISCLEKGNYILVLEDEINTTAHIITKN